MQLDDMVELALEALTDPDIEARALPLRLIQAAPAVAPLQVVVAMTLAAAALEGTMASPRDRAGAAACWRMAALLAADVHAMACLGLPARRAADLAAYWQAHDPFFMTPQAVGLRPAMSPKGSSHPPG